MIKILYHGGHGEHGKDTDLILHVTRWLSGPDIGLP